MVAFSWVFNSSLPLFDLFYFNYLLYEPFNADCHRIILYLEILNNSPVNGEVAHTITMTEFKNLNKIRFLSLDIRNRVTQGSFIFDCALIAIKDDMGLILDLFIDSIRNLM